MPTRRSSELDGLEFVNRRSTVPEVHADNPGGTRSDHAPHGIRIEIVRRGIDVREHRGDALPVEGVGCRSEEHTSELQSLMRISYAVFCLKKNISRLLLK